jgi:hypothetical protein
MVQPGPEERGEARVRLAHFVPTVAEIRISSRSLSARLIGATLLAVGSPRSAPSPCYGCHFHPRIEFGSA